MPVALAIGLIAAMVLAAAFQGCSVWISESCRFDDWVCRQDFVQLMMAARGGLYAANLLALLGWLELVRRVSPRAALAPRLGAAALAIALLQNLVVQVVEVWAVAPRRSLGLEWRTVWIVAQVVIAIVVWRTRSALDRLPDPAGATPRVELPTATAIRR